MFATVVQCDNAFDLTRARKLFPVSEPVTVRDWLDGQGIAEFTRPTICIHNGGALLRAEWPSTTIRDGDVCAFVALPQGGRGGGGKNPLATVLTVALMVGAIAAGQAWGAGLAIELWGGAGVITAAQAAYGTAIVTGAVAMGGSALLSTLVPAGKTANPAANWGGSFPAASPTYSLSSQGNQARLSQAIPCQYGRHNVTPDLASVPYQEYVDNDQYLHQLFCLGQGYYDIEAIRIDDTPLSAFPEVQTQIVEPGGTVTLFDPQVVTALEVAGQELVAPNELAEGEDGWVGPFALSDAEDTVTAIGIDVAFQRGIYYATTTGLASRTITWEVQVQAIDDDGVAIGDWLPLGSETITAATNTAQFRSFKYTVAAGRYQGRMRRTNDKDTSSQAGHEIRWAQARGYLSAAQNWPDVTFLAVKMRATDNLSSRSSRAFRVIATRKLPIWSAGSGWSAPQPTRSIVWAIADIFRARYGARLPDWRIPLASWAALDAKLEARGDHFDAVFDTQTTVWEAATRVAQCGRSTPILQGGFVRLFRDEPQDLPAAMFNGRNILKNSFAIKYVMPSDDTADAVTVEFFNARTWKTGEVTGRVRDEAYTAWLAAEGLTDTASARTQWAAAAEKPARRTMFGITDKAHALREAEHRAADNRYRRRFPTFRTEMEGLIPTYGDLVAVCYPLARWGLGGEVVAWTSDPPETDGDGKPVAWPNAILRLSEPPTWAEDGEHYIALRARDGAMVGPFLVTPGDTLDSVRVEEPLTLAPYVGSRAERTYFAFGKGDSYARGVRVLSIRPRKAGQEVEIATVVEDARVHVN